MNVVISDTAEYGCYLFNHAALPLLRDFVNQLPATLLGQGCEQLGNGVDNQRLIEVNDAIRHTKVELVGAKLRGYMTQMQQIAAS